MQSCMGRMSSVNTSATLWTAGKRLSEQRKIYLVLVGGFDGMNGFNEALDVGHLEAALVRCIITRHCPLVCLV